MTASFQQLNKSGIYQQLRQPVEHQSVKIAS